MAKVFVIQESPGKNILSAQNFGSIRMMYRDGVNVLFEQHSSDLSNTIGCHLKDYTPGEDWLLLIGDPILIGAACGWVARNFGELRLLKWDRQERIYVSIVVTIPDA